MVRVRLVGAPAVEVDGRSMPLPPGRPGALLAWLALHPGMHARRELAGPFWPDVLDESARTSLRTALYELRRVVGAKALVATREQVGLAPSVVVELAGPGELLEGHDEEWV